MNLVFSENTGEYLNKNQEKSLDASDKEIIFEDNKEIESINIENEKS